MSDLVSRLRLTIKDDGEFAYRPLNPDGPEAADRIEQLEAALRAVAGEFGDSSYPEWRDAYLALGMKVCDSCGRIPPNHHDLCGVPM